jgi:hypothetical protein
MQIEVYCLTKLQHTSFESLRLYRSNKRRVQPRRFTDCVSSNIIDRQSCNNSRCFIVPPAKSEQYKNSFFVKTTIEWNSLTDEQLPTVVSRQCDQ